MAEHVDPGGARQRQIQQRDIAGALGYESLRLLRSGNQLDGKLLGLQFLAEKIRQRNVILSDKDAHGHTRNVDFWKGRMTVCETFDSLSTKDARRVQKSTRCQRG